MTRQELEVLVDGAPIDPRRLLSVRVASRLSLPTQCELAVETKPGAAAEISLCPLGSRLRLRIAGADPRLFDGEVTCVEVWHGASGETQLRVRAYDSLHRLRKSRQTRVFENVTVADVATELGLAVDADETGPLLERVVQHREDDLELLTGLAARAGLYLASDGSDIRLTTLEGFGDALRFRLGESLLEARIEANLDRVAERSTVIAWHPQAAEPYVESTSDHRIGRDIAMTPAASDVGGDGRLLLAGATVRSAGELTALAQARLDASVARTVIATGVTEGDPRLRAGVRVILEGVAEATAGTYVVCEAIHTLDANGYRTAFSTAPPVRQPQTETATVTLGQVTAVDDPDGLGRVRVCLPAMGDCDIGWLGVLTPGAGRGKGLSTLPDTDDTVLILLPDGVPANGIVLGGLFGTIAPDDPGVVDGSVRRWSLRTPEGQLIVLDDAEQRLRIENRAGSFVELGADLLRFHSATDLVMEAPGRAVTIRASTVDFEQAGGD